MMLAGPGYMLGQNHVKNPFESLQCEEEEEGDEGKTKLKLSFVHRVTAYF